MQRPLRERDHERLQQVSHRHREHEWHKDAPKNVERADDGRERAYAQAERSQALLDVLLVAGERGKGIHHAEPNVFTPRASLTVSPDQEPGI